ncbi:hypothetical protein HUJ05_007949 [Dendroctonus ponderosae]|nr:hypothetical protein HUJ05_007949 [Dendroctonus ponderosae]
MSEKWAKPAIKIKNHQYELRTRRPEKLDNCPLHGIYMNIKRFTTFGNTEANFDRICNNLVKFCVVHKYFLDNSRFFLTQTAEKYFQFN